MYQVIICMFTFITFIIAHLKEMDSIIILILQRGKLNHREVCNLSKSHSSNWLRCNWDSRRMTSEPMP